MKYAGIIICITIFCTSAKAQKEAYIWQFGYDLGLDFNFSPPRLLLNGKIRCNDDTEASASISDRHGNLLFYTNGVNVWNRNNIVMPNGNDLLGNCSTTQTLIVPNPSDPNLFYIFTASAQGDDPQFPVDDKGFHYSIVDLSLENGMGDIVEKNILLEKSTTEKIAATLHANQKDVWVVMHEWNNNTFNAFLVTEDGVNTQKVSSVTGSKHATRIDLDLPSRNGALGQMKISSNGERLALIIYQEKTVEIFSFDSSNGKIKYLSQFKETVRGLPLYGLEFSHNNRFLYFSEVGKSIYQYDLDSGEVVILPNSDDYDYCGQLQLGPDGKIYVAKLGRYYLGIIEHPNEKGALADYQPQGIGLDIDGIHYSKGGLPNFISSYFFDPKVTQLPPFLEMPNIITPNGDNLNDEFVPLKFYNISSIAVSIFKPLGSTYL